MAPTIRVMYTLFCLSFSSAFLSFSSSFLYLSSLLCLSPSGVSSSAFFAYFFPLGTVMNRSADSKRVFYMKELMILALSLAAFHKSGWGRTRSPC
jgi:hypothetical protein